MTLPLQPVSDFFGFDRGTPVDRIYMTDFLAKHATDIKGRVLEVGNDWYTRDFGGDRVTRADVLHVEPGHEGTTILGDLAKLETIPANAFDCLVLTQVLQCIYDIHAAVRTTHHALKLGGVALVTISGIAQVSLPDHAKWGEYWRVTDASARKMFGAVYGDANVSVTTYGNAYAAAAFMYAYAAEELDRERLMQMHPSYQVTVAIRAVRA